MPAGRHVGVLLLLTCTATAVGQEVMNNDFHPTAAQVNEIQQSCDLAEAGMVALRDKVNAVVSDWNKATAGARPAVALKRLGEAFDGLRNDGRLSGRKSIYLLCVEKALRQFVDTTRAQPEPVAGSGNSSTLQLSDFRTEEEIWSAGCRQAEDDAASKLQARCGDRTLVVVNSQCAQSFGSVRTYTAEVQGECRDK